MSSTVDHTGKVADADSGSDVPSVSGTLEFIDVDSKHVGNAEDGSSTLKYTVTSSEDSSVSGKSGILSVAGKYGHLEYNAEKAPGNTS